MYLYIAKKADVRLLTSESSTAAHIGGLADTGFRMNGVSHIQYDRHMFVTQ